MSEKLVETVYGKRNKFEIYRQINIIANDKFIIKKDGSYFASSSTLDAAVAKAKKEGGVQ